MTGYLLAGPSGYSSTEQSPLRTSAVANFAGTYTITVTDNAGCTASATTVVVQLPAINPTAGSNTPFCNGGTLSLTSSGVGAVTYLWSRPLEAVIQALIKTLLLPVLVQMKLAPLL